ncbi:MAG: NAD(P)/FAD-dependent oxidoreductase [Patescibacteria group bacterium]
MKYSCIIIGGGAAGMMAAIQAAKNSISVALLEKNKILGKKLLLTGKSRCNLTTAKNKKKIIAAFEETGNGKFLWDSLNNFDNEDLCNWFRSRGLELKEERGKRIFPVTDKASSVVNVLREELEKQKITIHKKTKAKKIEKKDGRFTIKTNKKAFETEKVILATGGKSYPQTGSTGEGYKFCKQLGHRITSLKGSLVPFKVKDKDITSLQGLKLKNVTLSLYSNKNLITKQFGEMIFTHFGISGPIVLEASRFYDPEKHKNATAQIDFKPALDKETLDQRILREIKENLYLDYKNMLKNLLPSKIIPLTVKKTNIDPHKNISQLTQEERQKLIHLLKKFEFKIKGTLGIKEAIITAGGVDLAEIEPTTMESKLCPDLYIAGELLNLDGPTGGFNLQMCFTTGYTAGKAAGKTH